ncbi:HGGxSTG domain-containing protein [Bacillus pretiosus]|uniref:HGGxSTG domain-containing protein n=1 Tax=Bacillus pretiosus TaxID=2983392 RepID=UPI003D655897
MEKQVCGAMTRKGTPCQKAGIVKNGRCRLHGGKSTGPKNKTRHSASLRGNKNALKTGEHESIYYDTLLEDEKLLYGNMSTDCMESVIERIKLIAFRTRRIMQRYQEELLKDKPNDKRIKQLEDALTRIDGRFTELMREKRELMRDKPHEEDGSLDQLCNILNGLREQREK